MAQQQEKVQWLSFEQLEDSLAVKAKKVYIDFYAAWCGYCKKMDRVAYRDPQVIDLLNLEYYAVKMNADTKDTIIFGGDQFINEQIGKSRRPTHQIPLLLASREGQPFSLPAIVILNAEFKLEERFFEYMDAKQLLNFLQAH